MIVKLVFERPKEISIEQERDYLQIKFINNDLFRTKKDSQKISLGTLLSH